MQILYERLIYVGCGSVAYHLAAPLSAYLAAHDHPIRAIDLYDGDFPTPHQPQWPSTPPDVSKVNAMAALLGRCAPVTSSVPLPIITARAARYYLDEHCPSLSDHTAVAAANRPTLIVLAVDHDNPRISAGK